MRFRRASAHFQASATVKALLRAEIADALRTDRADD